MSDEQNPLKPGSSQAQAAATKASQKELRKARALAGVLAKAVNAAARDAQAALDALGKGGGAGGGGGGGGGGGLMDLSAQGEDGGRGEAPAGGQAGPEEEEEEEEEGGEDAAAAGVAAQLAASLVSVEDLWTATAADLAARYAFLGLPRGGGGAPMDEGAGGNPSLALAGGLAAAPAPGADDGESSGEASEEGHEDYRGSQGVGGGGGGGGGPALAEDAYGNPRVGAGRAWVTACFETGYAGYTGTKASVFHLYFISNLQYLLLGEFSGLSRALSLQRGVEYPESLGREERGGAAARSPFCSAHVLAPPA